MLKTEIDQLNEAVGATSNEDAAKAVVEKVHVYAMCYRASLYHMSRL